MIRTNYRRMSLVAVTAGALFAACGGGDNDGGLLGSPDGGGIIPTASSAARLERLAEVMRHRRRSARPAASPRAMHRSPVCASVDSFFQAVLDFQAKAGNVSAGIEGAARRDQGRLRHRSRRRPRDRAARRRSTPTSRAA